MASVKNYGLNGIGSDVQYGKAGGRVKFDGTTFSLTDAGGSALVRLKGAVGVAADDLVTVAQLDSARAGLRILSPCRVATDSSTMSSATWSGETSFASATPTAAEVGQFTGAPLVVDGITLEVGDRVLVRGEGIDYSDPENPVVSSGAESNGIYVVTTVGTGSNGVWRRANDHGGNLVAAADAATAYTRNNNSLRYGDYVFVNLGTTSGGVAYTISNTLDVTEADPSLEPDLNEDDDSGRVIFIKFSGAQTYTAGNGVELDGAGFRLDIDSLSDEGGTITGSDTFAMGDGVAAGPDSKATFSKLMADLNIVNVASYGSGIEFIANTSADTYSKYTLGASATAGLEGIDVTQNGSAIEFGLDVAGLTTAGTGVGTDLLVKFDGTNNVKTTVTAFLADHNIANLSSNGIAVRTAAGTYAARTITAGTNPNAGLIVTNGDGVAGNPTIGIDLTSLTAVGTVAGADVLLVSDTSDGTNNKRVTVQEIVDLANSAISTNAISQLNTSVTVTDTGADGTLTFVADGATVLTGTSAGLTASSLAVSDLTATRLVFAGTAGELTDDADLTYTVGTNTLNVVGLSATSASVGAITTTGAGVSVTGSGTITTTTGNISSTSGNITTGGNISTSGSGTITAAGGLIDSTLTVAGGIVFATGGDLAQDTGFTYNAGTDTLTVANLAVTNGFGLTEHLIQFGDATGNLGEDADFSFDTGVLTIGNLDLDGTTQTITGNIVDGDIHIVPNGDGEVILGSAGDAVLSSDAASALTVAGDTDLYLDSNSGSVFVRDNGEKNVAQFDATADADRWFTFTSDDSAAPLQIGTGGGDADIQFVLGTSNLVLVDSATDYETALATASDAALVTKGYVDSQIATGASEGSIQTRIVDVSLSSAATTNIGAALPANAIITQVTVHVSVASDAATAMDIGVSGTVDKYMSDAEIDAQTAGVYVSQLYSLEGSSVNVIATVATPGTTGTAKVLVEYRVPTL